MALNISDANREWIVTAYAITFGGFLLLGGRLGDTFGRRHVFVVLSTVGIDSSFVGVFGRFRTCSVRRSAHPIAQVQHPVALQGNLGILQ
ncbi:hypothetical protein [Rhodococcoides yunnanense]|uniref:hypothetical protein n=1 Tax=Rhodococcoides yunnanense TaxID=278209 RepID=UPI0009330C41|nr:hypothetical protein [Rhodococcus yunnanensis]